MTGRGHIKCGDSLTYTLFLSSIGTRKYLSVSREKEYNSYDRSDNQKTRRYNAWPQVTEHVSKQNEYDEVDET